MTTMASQITSLTVVHRSKKTSKLRVIGLCAGGHRSPVNSPQKGLVTRKMFPFDDVIMYLRMWDRFAYRCHFILRYRTISRHSADDKVIWAFFQVSSKFCLTSWRKLNEKISQNLSARCIEFWWVIASRETATSNNNIVILHFKLMCVTTTYYIKTFVLCNISVWHVIARYCFIMFCIFSIY